MTIITRLLALFPRHKRLTAASGELKRALDEASGARARLQGEVHALRGEVDRLREERDKASDSERTAYRMLVNIDCQMRYGFTPYKEAPHIPESKISTDSGGGVDAGYVHGRQLVEEAKEESREAFDNWLNQKGASA